jgi:hypothetical protein
MYVGQPTSVRVAFGVADVMTSSGYFPADIAFRHGFFPILDCIRSFDKETLFAVRLPGQYTRENR